MAFNSMQLIFYAADTQLYVALIPTNVHPRLSLLSDCRSAFYNWFCHNSLTFNTSKPESILIGTRQRLCTIPAVASPKLAGIPIPFSETIIMLGVTLDQNLTLNNHISSLSDSIHLYICATALTEPMTLYWVHLWYTVQAGLRQLHYVWNVSI